MKKYINYYEEKDSHCLDCLQQSLHLTQFFKCQNKMSFESKNIRKNYKHEMKHLSMNKI